MDAALGESVLRLTENVIVACLERKLRSQYTLNVSGWVDVNVVMVSPTPFRPVPSPPEPRVRFAAQCGTMSIAAAGQEGGSFLPGAPAAAGGGVGGVHGGGARRLGAHCRRCRWSPGLLPAPPASAAATAGAPVTLCGGPRLSATARPLPSPTHAPPLQGPTRCLSARGMS